MFFGTYQNMVNTKHSLSTISYQLCVHQVQLLDDHAQTLIAIL